MASDKTVGWVWSASKLSDGKWHRLGSCIRILWEMDDRDVSDDGTVYIIDEDGKRCNMIMGYNVAKIK